MCGILQAGKDQVAWPAAAHTGMWPAAVVQIGIWGPVHIGRAYGAMVTGAAAWTWNATTTHYQPTVSKSKQNCKLSSIFSFIFFIIFSTGHIVLLKSLSTFLHRRQKATKFIYHCNRIVQFDLPTANCQAQTYMWEWLSFSLTNLGLAKYHTTLSINTVIWHTHVAWRLQYT